MAFTTNQWAILALVFLLGWLLGLASRSSGRKHKRALAAEQERRLAAERRIAELERGDRATLTGTTAASVGTAAAGGRDDLSLIRGVGMTGETRLNEAGFHRFSQVASMSDHDAAALESRLGAERGTVAREEWREQAAMLAARRHDDHRTRYGSDRKVL